MYRVSDKPIKRLYEMLYNDVQETAALKDVAHFVSMRGPYYEQCRLMLIGIAPNGWGQLRTDSAEAFGSEAQNQFDDLTRWNWIQCKNRVLYNSNGYCVSQKPFWTYSKEIFQNISGDMQDCDVWMNNIAWSNLYKLSPLMGYNPDPQLMKIQLAVCREILRAELEIYQPTHILMCTGFDLFAPFAEVFEIVKDTGNRNFMSGKNKNTDYVEGLAYVHNAKAVIACRPEYRDKADYVSQVVNAFQKA